MTQEKKDNASRINDMDSGKDKESTAPLKPDQVFLKGAERKRRRRLDLRTLHGTLRESARIYRDLAEGRISQVDAEVRSRVLGRHRDILAALTQSQQLEAIQQQLAVLRGEPSSLLPRMEHEPSDSPEVTLERDADSDPEGRT